MFWGAIHHGDGDGTQIVFPWPTQKGAPTISGSLRGFDGWTSRPAWMPGGWQFFTPHLLWGRIFVGQRRRTIERRWGPFVYRDHWIEMRVLLPAKLVDPYRHWKWKRKGLWPVEPAPAQSSEQNGERNG